MGPCSLDILLSKYSSQIIKKKIIVSDKKKVLEKLE